MPRITAVDLVGQLAIRCVHSVDATSRKGRPCRRPASSRKAHEGQRPTTTSSWSEPDSPACTLLHRLSAVAAYRVLVARGRRRRWRHVVLEPLPGRPLRRRQHRLLLHVRRGARTRSGPGASAMRRSRRSSATSNYVTDRLDLRPHIRFGARVVAAVYDEDDPALDDRRPSTAISYSAQFLRGGDGLPLGARTCPTFDGRDRFQGDDPAHRQVAARRRRPHWPARRGDRHRILRAVQPSRSSPSRPRSSTVFQRTANFSLPAGQSRDRRTERVAAPQDHSPSWRRERLEQRSGLRPSSPVRWRSSWRSRTTDDGGLRGARPAVDQRRAARDPRSPSRASSRRSTRNALPGRVLPRARSARWWTTPRWRSCCAPTTIRSARKRLCANSFYHETFNRTNVYARRRASRPRSSAFDADAASVLSDGRRFEFDAIVLRPDSTR